MSRTKRFIGGLSLGYINMALVTLTGLWLTRFLLKRLGQHDYGLWLVGTQMLSYLMLMDFGVVALLPRETAYALGRAGDVQRATELPELIGQTIRLVIWQIPLVATAALVMWYAMPAGWEALRKPLALVLVAFVLAFPLRIFQAVLQGLQDLSFLGVTQMVSWLLSTALTVAFVFAGFGLYSLAIGWVAGQAISTVVWSYRSRHRFPSVFPTISSVFGRAFKRRERRNFAKAVRLRVTRRALIIWAYERVNGSQICILPRGSDYHVQYHWEKGLVVKRNVSFRQLFEDLCSKGQWNCGVGVRGYDGSDCIWEL